MGDLPEPVCDPIVKADNYAATVGTDISISSETLDEDVMARMLILYGPLSVALDAEGMEYYGDGVDMGEVCASDILKLVLRRDTSSHPLGGLSVI